MTNSLFYFTALNGKKAFVTFPTFNKDEFINLMVEAGIKINNVYEVGEVPLRALPSDVQSKVETILQDFRKAYVTYEQGRFEVSACVGIQNKYPMDYFSCGTYTK